MMDYYCLGCSLSGSGGVLRGLLRLASVSPRVLIGELSSIG